MFPSSLRCNRQEARQSQSTIGLFRAHRDATMRISLLVCGTKLPSAPVSQAGFVVNFGQDAMRDGEGVAVLAEINPFSRRPPDCDTSHLVATRYACSDGPLSGKGNRGKSRTRPQCLGPWSQQTQETSLQPSEGDDAICMSSLWRPPTNKSNVCRVQRRSYSSIS